MPNGNVVCISCGAPKGASDRFCTQCGHPLASIPPPGSGQYPIPMYPTGHPAYTRVMPTTSGLTDPEPHKARMQRRRTTKLVIGAFLGCLVVAGLCVLLIAHNNHPPPTTERPASQPSLPNMADIPRVDVGALDLDVGAYMRVSGQIQAIPAFDKDHPLQSFQRVPTFSDGTAPLIVDLPEQVHPAMVKLLEQTEMPSPSNPKGKQLDLTSQVVRCLSSQPNRRTGHVPVIVVCPTGMKLFGGTYGLGVMTPSGTAIYFPFRIR